MLNKVVSIIVFIVVLTIGLVIIGHSISDTRTAPLDENRIEEVAYGLNDVNRIRFEGYNDTHNNIIDRVFTEDLAQEIKTNLQANSENKFISYEDTAKEHEQWIADAQDDTSGFNQYQYLDPTESDYRLKTINGERGFYLSDIESIGNTEVKICGIEEEINADTSKYIGSLVGNKFYDFEVESFYCYEKSNGTIVLRVKTRSKDQVDPFIIEYTCYLDSNYQIKQIDDTALLYSKLLREATT